MNNDKALKLVKWADNLIKGPSKLNDELQFQARLLEKGVADPKEVCDVLSWASNNVSGPCKFNTDVDYFIEFTI